MHSQRAGEKTKVFEPHSLLISSLCNFDPLGCSQIFENCHTFKGLICYVYVCWYIAIWKGRTSQLVKNGFLQELLYILKFKRSILYLDVINYPAASLNFLHYMIQILLFLRIDLRAWWSGWSTEAVLIHDCRARSECSAELFPVLRQNLSILT